MIKNGNIFFENPVYIIIAVTVVLLIGSAAFGANIPRYFNNLFPTLNGTLQLKDGEGIIGYNLAKNTVNYYDGSSWRLINNGAGVSYSGKDYPEADLNDAFVNYYYELNEKIRQKNANVSLNSAGKEFYDKDSFPPLGAYILGITPSITNKGIFRDSSTGNAGVYGIIVDKYYITSGTVPDSTFSSNSPEPHQAVYNWFIINYSNSMYLSKDGKNYDLYTRNGGNRQKLIALVQEWRDSILSHPMNLNGEYYCVEKNDPYLIIRLGEESSSDAVC